MSKITVRNKIGFHAAPAGNHNGIGDYYRRLDEAGIPFVIKSVDHYGHVHEALQYSNADHIYVYRLSSFGQPGNYDFDVPEYDLDPDEAAAKHMKHMKNHLPPEYWPNRDKVWIEPINEIDRNRADWLGHFACEFAVLAEQEGMKTMQYAWCSGEPEPDQWELEGQMKYLRLCAEKPEMFGVALHEYSYDKNDIWRLDGNLVGRFVHLFAACDKHGIARPPTIMTEWGWTHRVVPDPNIAMRHIEEVNELYAKYPSILGAAIWYLGSNFGQIHNQTQRLIKPVIDFSLKWKIEVEPDLPASAPGQMEVREAPETAVKTAPPPPSVMAVPKPQQAPSPAAAQSKATFMADVTIPDDMEIPAGDSFTKTWRFKNTGQTTWGTGFKPTHVHGTAMTNKTEVPVPAAKPGQVIQVSVPMTAPRDTTGTVVSDWRMVDAQGKQFGDMMYARIAVLPPPPSGIKNLTFRADVTIPDDTAIEAGKSFTKTWQVRNIGNQSWQGCKLAFVGGATMSQTQEVSLPAADPGDTVDVSVDMVAPGTPGSHWSDWRAKDSSGEYFGDIIYVRITVPAPEANGRIQPLSQNDPRWKGTRLGDSHSTQTIGSWGCMLACYTMLANSFGKNLSPTDLNTRLLRKKLFLDHNATPYNALDKLYSDIIYEGRVETRLDANITARIDASLKAGNPVAVQVDYTPNSPYSPNDQHWVLIVGRKGVDYEINDPWLYPATQASMRQRYGRSGKLLRHSIISAVFYRSAQPQQPLPVFGGGVLSGGAAGGPEAKTLQTGLTINPLAPNSNPHNEDTLKGIDWVRFVYKVDTQPDATQRSLGAAYKIYDETIRDYNRMGTGSIIVLNQDTVWGQAPWTGRTKDWDSYVAEMAETAGKIAKHYARYGDKIAYEIWQTPNSPDSKEAVSLDAQQYAKILQKTVATIQANAPNAQVLFGGMAAGPDENIAYVQAVRNALGGKLPAVDGIGIHPFGRWGTKAPFDWDNTFGTISQAVAQYEREFPKIPLWITAMGVASGTPLGREYDQDIANYWLDVCKTIADRHPAQVRALIWFAWSDFMHNAGIVEVTGKPKPALMAAMKKVAEKNW